MNVPGRPIGANGAPRPRSSRAVAGRRGVCGSRLAGPTSSTSRRRVRPRRRRRTRSSTRPAGRSGAIRARCLGRRWPGCWSGGRTTQVAARARWTCWRRWARDCRRRGLARSEARRSRWMPARLTLARAQVAGLRMPARADHAAGLPAARPRHDRPGGRGPVRLTGSEAGLPGRSSTPGNEVRAEGRRPPRGASRAVPASLSRAAVDRMQDAPPHGPFALGRTVLACAARPTRRRPDSTWFPGNRWSAG